MSNVDPDRESSGEGQEIPESHCFNLCCILLL